MTYASLPPAPEHSKVPAARTSPEPTLQARAAALIAATQEANARRLAEARAHAAAIIADAELANTEFLRLAEGQAAVLLAATPAVRELSPLSALARPDTHAPGADIARVHPEVGAEDRSRAAIDGGVDLIAGPFGRFSELATFTRSVRGLQGVLSLDTREFLKGTVHLRLRYEDPIPLLTRLTELSEFRPSIVEAISGRVVLRVNLVDPEVFGLIQHAA